MINFDDYVNENKTEHNKNWPYTPEHPYRILIIGGSGSKKANTLINLTNEQNEQKDLSEPKYEYLLKNVKMQE